MTYELYFQETLFDSSDNEREFKEILQKQLSSDFDEWIEQNKNDLNACDIREEITTMNGLIEYGTIQSLLEQLNDFNFGYSIVLS